MPKVERHPPGTFCWIELATTDQAGATSFYSALFGWAASDSPVGSNEYYTRFQLNGETAAAAFTMRADERSRIPPHWGIYVAVYGADDAAQRAAELGGIVLEPPFDVATYARMAVIQDPTGAVFCIWQPKDHIGTTVTHESGTMCWADLSTPDPDRAMQFYESLFGWKIGPAENYPPDYLLINSSQGFIGGVPPAAYRNPQVPPHWMAFFQVGDVDGVTAKAQKLGGAVHLAPMSAGGARLAVLADPQGAAFSIIKPPSQG